MVTPGQSAKVKRGSLGEWRVHDEMRARFYVSSTPLHIVGADDEYYVVVLGREVRHRPLDVAAVGDCIALLDVVLLQIIPAADVDTCGQIRGNRYIAGYSLYAYQQMFIAIRTRARTHTHAHKYTHAWVISTTMILHPHTQLAYKPAHTFTHARMQTRTKRKSRMYAWLIILSITE